MNVGDLLDLEMDIEYLEQLWKNDSHKASRKQGDRASWDSRVEEFNSDQPDERIGKILGLLLEKGMLHENSSVLDVGSGPGKFVIEFARKAKNVVGADISPNMLQEAENNLAAKGLDNVEFTEVDWEKADLAALKWRKKFSLVTAIMSPAFSSKEGLEKMLEASHEYGLITHFIQRQDSIGDELRDHIIGRKSPNPYGNKTLYCSFNLLWLYRLFPEIVYFNTVREVSRPLEEAGRHYINRLEVRAPLMAAQQAEIQDVLKAKAENGIIRETITAKIACIYWKNN